MLVKLNCVGHPTSRSFSHRVQKQQLRNRVGITESCRRKSLSHLAKSETGRHAINVVVVSSTSRVTRVTKVPREISGGWVGGIFTSWPIVKLSSSRRWQQQQRMILVVKYEITLKKQIHWWDWRERANCLPIPFPVYPRPQLPLVQPLVCFLLKGRRQRKRGLLGNFIEGICLEGKFWFFLRSV